MEFLEVIPLNSLKIVGKIYKIMRVSIITICYNRKSTIEQSIKSVLGQDYPHIEYIVIDGNHRLKAMKNILNPETNINILKLTYK